MTRLSALFLALVLTGATPVPLAAPIIANSGSVGPRSDRTAVTVPVALAPEPGTNPKPRGRGLRASDVLSGAPFGPESRLRATFGAPLPTSGVSGIVEGWATFCDPTPKHCHGWDDGRRVGAVRGYIGPPYTAEVCAGKRCTLVLVVSVCGCGDRHGIPTVIDLSAAAAAEIEPDYRRVGVWRVTVEWPVRLPATDAEPRRSDADLSMFLEARDDNAYR